AVIKLLDLDDKAGPIVTGSVDFAKKVNFVRTSAYQQAGNNNDKQFAEQTCDDVFDINDVRQIVIHSSFEPAPGGGVQFKGTVARKGCACHQRSGTSRLRHRGVMGLRGPSPPRPQASPAPSCLHSHCVFTAQKEQQVECSLAMDQ